MDNLKIQNMKLFFLKSIKGKIEYIKEQKFYRYVLNNKHGFVLMNIYTDTTSVSAYDLYINEKEGVVGFNSNYEIKTIDTSIVEEEGVEFEDFLNSHPDNFLFNGGSQHLVLNDYVKNKYYQSINKKPPTELHPGELVRLNFGMEEIKTNSSLKKFDGIIDLTFIFLDVLSQNRQMAVIQLPGGKDFTVKTEFLTKLEYI